MGSRYGKEISHKGDGLFCSGSGVGIWSIFDGIGCLSYLP